MVNGWLYVFMCVWFRLPLWGMEYAGPENDGPYSRAREKTGSGEKSRDGFSPVLSFIQL